MIVPALHGPGASRLLVAFAYAYLTCVASARLVTTALRWAAALTGASLAYFLVMRVLIALWQDSAHAAIGYAGAMAVAVMCGAWVACTLLLPGHRRAGAWTCTALGMLYPMLLAAAGPPHAPIRAAQVLFVAAAAVGGIAVLRSLPLTPGAAVPHHARS